MIDIVGHRAQRDAFKRLVGQRSLAQTVLFSGPAGVGKSLVALELAKTLVCLDAFHAPCEANYGGCCKCKNCLLFDAGNLADLYRIECLDKENCSAGSIRRILSSISLRAFHGAARVVLINDAELMPLQGANILLKSLEEPADGVYFFLISANPARMPATVLSRCQRWNFNLLTSREIKKIISRSGAVVEGLSLEEASLLADGSMENISGLAKEAGLWKECERGCADAVAGRIDSAVAFAKDLSSPKDRALLGLNLIRIIARRNIRNGGSPAETGRWARLLEDAILARELIRERNFNAGYLLADMFISVSEAGCQGLRRDVIM